jgi:hypothetical protein
MVARIDNELLTQTLLTPQPDLSDSDEVLLSVETARALETRGEFREAARWLRRAADDAEQQGNDERYLVLARAAADMVNIVGSSPPPAADAPTLPPPAPDGFEASDAQLEASQSQLETSDARLLEANDAQLEAGDAQHPPTTPPPESLEPTIPPPASALPTLPPPFPASATISSPPDMPFTERSMRIGAIRVAILEASIRGAKSFFVERLDKGQLPPAGTTEAMLVFTGDAEDSAEEEVNLLTASDSILP